MAEIASHRFQHITIDGREQVRDVMLGLRWSDVTAAGRAHDNQRCTRSIIDAGAATAPDLHRGRTGEKARVREPLRNLLG